MTINDRSPLNLPPQRRNARPWLAWTLLALGLLCACGIGMFVLGSQLFESPLNDGGHTDSRPQTAALTVAVSPSMAPTFQQLVADFNAQGLQTPDGQQMQVEVVVLEPQQMVEQSLGTPTFHALNPDSSLWINQLEQHWAAQTAQDEDEMLIPIGARRVSAPVRYAVTPIVIAAWDSVARNLGWPQEPVGWQQIQNTATRDPNFKWNHPSTNNASGMLATLAEFYAGAGLTRGLTPEAATAQSTLNYVRAVEATIRFYGEGEQVIVQRLAAEGRNFLDAFVAQEQVVIAWNQGSHSERLVAIYPAEGTLWADHPLALLELGANGETPLTANQRRTYQALASFLLAPGAQQQLLLAGYRPADLDIALDAPPSPFANTDAVDWREPQTTLQMPSAAVVEVVQNVWWYTKRPTNVMLVVDTSGSMEGDKMSLTQQALVMFIEQMQGDRDQVGLVEFGGTVKQVQELRRLTQANRDELTNIIYGMRPQGNTALLDATGTAYEYLINYGDTEAINAIVVMTDGRENASRLSQSDLQRRFSESSDVQVVVFTIGFGRDVDVSMLESVAETGNGQFRRADETDIQELYKIISTYF